MSEQSPWMEFSRFVPGFDFLRNLAPPTVLNSAAHEASPANAFQHWLAPTMDEAEVQKRVDELKVVKFWLDQNSRALEATIQALEVQKMTLSALKSMNQSVQQAAQAFSEGVQESVAPFPGVNQQQAAASPVGADSDPAQHESPIGSTDGIAEIQQAQQQAMQWWGALTEQFQTIATKAMDDIGQNMMQAGMAPNIEPNESQPSNDSPEQRAMKKPASRTTKKTVQTVKKPVAKKTPAPAAKPAASRRSRA